MLTGPPPLRPYGYLSDGSAGRLMDRVAEAIARDPTASSLLASPKSKVISDIKVRVKTTGSPAIKALYWSVRCPDPDAWGGLRARTLLAESDRLEWLDLPHDPALPALATLPARPGSWQVLNYVPLRRAVLLHRPPDGPARVVKVKRPDRAAEAARRLGQVQQALGRTAGINIPRLLEVCPDGLFVLSFCRGTPLCSDLPDNASGILRGIGRMHATLHAQSPAGLPHEPQIDAIGMLGLAAALRQDLTLALVSLARVLLTPPVASAPVLCHGDLGLDQILNDGGTLSLMDFDRCHAGDAAADIARFLVALSDNPIVGMRPAEAEAAYLSGYATVRALPRPERLTWYRAEALAARLLVCLRKDLPTGRLLAQVPIAVPA